MKWSYRKKNVGGVNSHYNFMMCVCYYGLNLISDEKKVQQEKSGWGKFTLKFHRFEIIHPELFTKSILLNLRFVTCSFWHVLGKFHRVPSVNCNYMLIIDSIYIFLCLKSICCTWCVYVKRAHTYYVNG